MLSKRRLIQKTTYCMKFTWNLQKRQFYRDRKQISGCLELEMGWKTDWKQKAVWGDENVLKLGWVITAQLYKFTRNHSILKMGTFYGI